MSKQITVGGKQVEVDNAVYEQLLVETRKEVGSFQDLVGQKWFFRGVTNFLVGKVKNVVYPFVFLSEASWVADTGKFSTAIKDGELSEVEVVGDAAINLLSVVDMFPWNHDLPKKTK